jgi:hypothetical protein
VPHCDPDALALRALGEPVSAADEAHLASCPSCQSELDQLRAVVTTARHADVDEPVVAPPAHVWDAIASQLDLNDRSQPTAPAPRAEAEREVRVVSTAPPAVAPAMASRARGRRRRTPVVLLTAAAAVVGLLIGVVGAAVIDRSPQGEVLARTSLEPVDAGDAHGQAVLRSTAEGRVLKVVLTDLPKTTGFYEVWFMNADTGGAVSLGSLDAQHPTTFAVPAGLRLSDYPYVDVSVEPLDGNPAHSSASIARGRLGA